MSSKPPKLFIHERTPCGTPKEIILPRRETMTEEKQVILEGREWAYIEEKIYDVSVSLINGHEMRAAVQIGKLTEAVGSINRRQDSEPQPPPSRERKESSTK